MVEQIQADDLSRSVWVIKIILHILNGARDTEWIDMHWNTKRLQAEDVRQFDERIISSLLEIRDHPVVKDSSTSLFLAVSKAVSDITEWLREKTDKSRKAYEGYVIWKARALNNRHAIMDFQKRKAAADSKPYWEFNES